MNMVSQFPFCVFCKPRFQAEFFMYQKRSLDHNMDVQHQRGTYSNRAAPLYFKEAGSACHVTAKFLYI